MALPGAGGAAGNCGRLAPGAAGPACARWGNPARSRSIASATPAQMSRRHPTADPLAGVQIAGEPGHRIFTLVEGTLDPQGEKIPGVGTVYREAYRLRRSIREDDPNLRRWRRRPSTLTSAVNGESGCGRTVCAARRPRISCARRLSRAWEGPRVVYSRTWEKKIPRHLV